MAGKRISKLKKITKKMQRKLTIIFVLILIALIALNVKLIYINAASGDKYTKKVLSQKGYRSETIPFRRGAIKDINGEVLAISEKVYYVILDCKVLNEVSEKTRDKVQETAVKALTEHFEELDEATLWSYIKDKPDSSYIRILKEVPYDSVQAFKNDMEAQKKAKKEQDARKKKNGGKLPDGEEEIFEIQGVWFEETYIRNYPNDYMASNLLGFTLSGDVGNWGVEEYYNDVLNGISGRTYGYLNGDSNLETVTKAAVDGNNLILNINAGIQKIVEKHVTAFNEEHRNEARPGLGSKHTAVIVADPRTCAILAECSYPYYNLNEPRDLTYIGAYTDAVVQAMSEEEKLTNMSAIWRNFCISDTYEPGSTFKLFTSAMGLESGKLTGAEKFYCDGYEIVDGIRVKCSHTSGHGNLDFTGAIAQSCNDALMQMSYKIGVDTFTEYQARFGFGKKTGIDLKGEVNAAGLLFTKDNMKDIDLAVNAFGQNFNVTMTQMMAGFCALVNGGYYYQPQVAARIENPEGEVLETFRPKLLKQIISKETSDMIHEQIRAVVESGTALSAKVPGYDVGGKTGTAEKFPRGQGTYLVSFIGCAPVDDPEIAVYVVIDEPNVENQANSLLAIRLCQAIMSEVLPYCNVTSIEDVSGEDAGEVPIDWSVVSEETWNPGEGFSDGDIETPVSEDSDYYRDGDTAYTGDNGENGSEVVTGGSGDTGEGTDDGETADGEDTDGESDDGEDTGGESDDGEDTGGEENTGDTGEE